MGKRLMAVAACAVAVACASCSGGGGESAPATVHTITGSVTLQGGFFTSSTYFNEGEQCVGGVPADGGNSDINGPDGLPDDAVVSQTQVTVKNASGKIIAVGGLRDGTVVAKQCVFPFTVKQVKDSDFYAIEVAQRGAKTLSKADLAKKKWFVALSE